MHKGSQGCPNGVDWSRNMQKLHCHTVLTLRMLYRVHRVFEKYLRSTEFHSENSSTIFTYVWLLLPVLRRLGYKL